MSIFLVLAVSCAVAVVSKMSLQEVKAAHLTTHLWWYCFATDKSSYFLTHPHLADLRLFQAIIRDREAQLQHLHSVRSLSGGGRSRGLEPDGVDNPL